MQDRTDYDREYEYDQHERLDGTDWLAWIERELEYQGLFDTDQDNDYEAPLEGDSEYQDKDGQSDYGKKFLLQSRARGKIAGKFWAPPSIAGLPIPVFVRLEDIQSEKPARNIGETPDEGKANPEGQ